MHKILLTFDTEDFTSEISIWALALLLNRLKNYNLKALFFITGHMAEKLVNYPEIVDLLETHAIGYHSSSHSVHPTIFEFTDVENYEKSYEVSSKRETSHVNPLTGAIEGRGGLLFLRDLFPSKQIVAYRSPGFCWSPPHLEALRDLGIQFDFSANISSVPVCYNGLTFYPYPAVAEWQGNLFDYRSFLVSILKNDIVVLASHPSLFVNQDDWDSIYWKGNPKQISPPRQRKASDFKSQFRSFDLLLRQIKHAEKAGLIEVTSKLTVSKRMLSLTKKDVERIYRYSMIWPKKVFSYYPTFLRYHFFKFFDSTSQK